ncbi:MAG TPA: response regulator [Phycisphaerae bacterium]|nr:response regulator [Phycisphaerae bacterium]
MSETGTKQCRILLLDAVRVRQPELVELLQQLGEVHVEGGIESALNLLRQGRFDLFIGGSEEFLAGEQVALSMQLTTVLDTLGQAVCLMDVHGRILWSNSKLKEVPQEALERIERHVADACAMPQEPASFGRPRSLSLISDGHQLFEARITPIQDPRGATRLVVAFNDVTRARRLQQKMDAIDNAGRELVRVDAEQISRMTARQRLDLLECKIIRFTRELLNFDNFVVRLLDKKTNRLELVLCAGLPPDAQQIDIFCSPEGSGISGYVAFTGRSYICPDVSQDPRYLQGIDNARSSLTVPLWLHDQVVGIFNIESDKLAAFREDDRQFAEIFGRYIAITLHILDLLVVERHETTGRLASNVSAEISGPLNEILADASMLMEDYIGHDDLRHRLQSIADNVVRIRDVIKQVAEPVSGILGSRTPEPQTDPLLEGRGVLVIDDEEIIRQTVHDVLARYGCRVDTAREGNEAIALVRQRTYDLIVSDIRMPGSNGYDIFKAVKEARPGCPVMFITGFGYDPSHSIIRATPEGLAAVLYKPFKVDELLAEVRKALASQARKD